MENILLAREGKRHMPLKQNHKVVEKALGITLHPEYASFLDEHGDYESEGIEIYGYSPEYKNIDAIPCVIGATKLYQESHKLTSGEIVIADTGCEGFIVVLNNDSGDIIEISLERMIEKKISSSFNDWLEKEKNNMRGA